MTTYNTIADSDIDPESPGTTTLFTRLRDNPIAITEGAAGAPAIANAALAGYPFSIVGGDISDAGFTFLESWTPTATSSKDFTWDETLYSQVKIIIERVSPATDSVDMQVLFGYNNGASFITSGYAYSTLTTGATTLVGATVQASIVITPDSVGTSGGQSLSASITLSGILKHAGGTDAAPTIMEFVSSSSDGGGIERVYAGTAMTTASPTQNVDSVRLQWSSGNFDASQGTIYVYGLKRA